MLHAERDTTHAAIIELKDMEKPKYINEVDIREYFKL